MSADDHILLIDRSPTSPKRPLRFDYPGRWQLSAVDAAEAKAAFYGWLRSKNHAPPEWGDRPSTTSFDPDDYARQYVGARLDRAIRRFAVGGDRIVIIHAERKRLMTSEDALDRSELLVSDGGHSFFDAWYDVDRAELLMFAFHGLG